ncbi:hypothetical protein Pmani_004323 [Petrolisthes manimaculis]|uniref:Uncharacterized protein n=1 Tax=Petrolisthes manimaculis TaxID=1843537 RepID=A0AAE1QE27_9EUCA|nr:hypothetical protein Pmani_004323 [Petrolisthes manimaculis]
MTCGQRGEYVNKDDMWTERHQTSPPAVRLDSDKMQCANIFFILSIGFASAALAVGNPCKLASLESSKLPPKPTGVV